MLEDLPKVTRPVRLRARLVSRTVPWHDPSSFLSMNEWVNEVGDAYEMTHPNPSSARNTASHQTLLEVHGALLLPWLVPSGAGINPKTIGKWSWQYFVRYSLCPHSR